MNSLCKTKSIFVKSFCNTLNSWLLSVHCKLSEAKSEVGPFQYELIPESRFRDIVAFLRNHFHDEPLNVALGVFQKGETCERLKEYEMKTLKYGVSYMAIDTKSGKIAGASLNGISHKGEAEEELEKMKYSDDIKYNRLMGLIYSNNVEVELFKKYNVDELFDLRILTVDHHYRGKGLAQKLLEVSEQLAMEKGYTLLKVDATSFFTQKICTKLGFETIRTVLYKEIKDENGKYSYTTAPPHEAYKIMVKYISDDKKKV
ncbi:hypothetical protein WA026_009409 [Henosepilachna vigintioctopunctata]|uniref:aralkylamine N-acetyltransferase n=1 Tax=Henosepilachna vigintioctopunctata TaxID=420089 RepID=A0AAW1U3V1_9CUCU